MLLTVLVTAMASKVRLSAQTAYHNQAAVESWADISAAVNKSYMELMLERMPRPIGEALQQDEDGEVLIPAYRFNGQPLTLNYPADEDMVVRIYDHGGKINLNRIPRRNMQLLIEKRLGGEDADPEEVQDLLAAWTDWTDLNELVSLNGAEDEYYQSLDPPYFPRNNPELETAEEILQIRGFAELFEGVNLDAAFTIYGSNRSINLNLATREAMELLPGLDQELIERVIAYREIEDINNRAELAEIIPYQNLVELSNWVGNNTSTIYSIFAYPRIEIDPDEIEQTQAQQLDFNPDPITQAYMEVVEVRSFNSLPRVFKVDPYGILPDTAPARIHEFNIEF